MMSDHAAKIYILETIDPKTVKSISILKDNTTTNIKSTKQRAVKTPSASNDKENVIKFPENNNILYIIDGKEVTETQNIPPENIKSVTVLRDAAAVKLYGQKAKNGVIVITTK